MSFGFSRVFVRLCVADSKRNTTHSTETPKRLMMPNPVFARFAKMEKRRKRNGEENRSRPQLSRLCAARFFFSLRRSHHHSRVRCVLRPAERLERRVKRREKTRGANGTKSPMPSFCLVNDKKIKRAFFAAKTPTKSKRTRSRETRRRFYLRHGFLERGRLRPGFFHYLHSRHFVREDFSFFVFFFSGVLRRMLITEELTILEYY